MFNFVRKYFIGSIMNKGFIRSIACAICALALGANTIIAQAQTYTAPDQDADGSYLLGSVDDLKWFAKATMTEEGSQYSARLITDLTYNGKPFASSEDYPYTGTFDGNFYSLTLNMTVNGEDYVGLFQYVGKSTFRNVVLKGTINTDAQYNGSLIGKVTGRVDVEESSIDVTLATSYNDGGDEFDGGFFGYVDNFNKNFSITDCAFTGCVNKTNTDGTNHAYVSGIVGKGITDEQQGEITDTYVYPTVQMSDNNYTLCAVGRVYNRNGDLVLDQYTIRSFFIMLPQGVPTENIAYISNPNIFIASAQGFAGGFEDAVKKRVEVITYDDFDALKESYTTYKRGKPVVDPVFYELYSVDEEVWYADPECTIPDNEEGNYTYITYNKEVDYNVYKNLVNKSLWKQGSRYPELVVPSVSVANSAAANAEWNKVSSWAYGEIPTYSDNITIQAGKSVKISAAKASLRNLVIEEGATLTITGSGFCGPNNVVVNGTLLVDGKTTLRTRTLSVGPRGKVNLHYDYENNSPSLICYTEDIDNVEIERDFYSNYNAHVGASTLNCEKQSISGWMNEYYFDPTTKGWVGPFYTDERTMKMECWDWDDARYDLETSEDNVFAHPAGSGADITLGRFFMLSGETIGAKQTMLEFGKPVSARKKFTVNTSNRYNGSTVVFNNPYPYTVDLNTVSSAEVGSIVWKERFGTIYKYNVYNLGAGIDNGIDRTADPFIAPFKTVTYVLKDGVNSFTLPNTPAEQSNAQISKSASVRDDYFKIAISVDNGESLCDAVALAFMNHGTLEADVVNVDSYFTLNTVPVDPKNPESGVRQESTQIKVLKPSSNVDLSIAVFPKQASVVNKEIPICIVPTADAVTNLTIKSINADRFFESGYEVYLHDRLLDKFHNLSDASEYVVPVGDVDGAGSEVLISDDRFTIVIVVAGNTPDLGTSTSLEPVSDDEMSNLIIKTEGTKVIVSNVPDSSIGQPIDLYNLSGQLESATIAEKDDNVLEAQSTGIHAVTLGIKESKKVLIGK